MKVVPITASLTIRWVIGGELKDESSDTAFK